MGGLTIILRDPDRSSRRLSVRVSPKKLRKARAGPPQPRAMRLPTKRPPHPRLARPDVDPTASKPAPARIRGAGRGVSGVQPGDNFGVITPNRSRRGVWGVLDLLDALPRDIPHTPCGFFGAPRPARGTGKRPGVCFAVLADMGGDELPKLPRRTLAVSVLGGITPKPRAGTLPSLPGNSPLALRGALPEQLVPRDGDDLGTGAELTSPRLCHLVVTAPAP